SIVQVALHDLGAELRQLLRRLRFGMARHRAHAVPLREQLVRDGAALVAGCSRDQNHLLLRVHGGFSSMWVEQCPNRSKSVRATASQLQEIGEHSQLARS